MTANRVDVSPWGKDGESRCILTTRFHGRFVYQTRTRFGEAKNKVYIFRVRKHLRKAATGSR